MGDEEKEVAEVTEESTAIESPSVVKDAMDSSRDHIVRLPGEGGRKQAMMLFENLFGNVEDLRVGGD
jgi:hypothetical protein